MKNGRVIFGVAILYCVSVGAGAYGHRQIKERIIYVYTSRTKIIIKKYEYTWNEIKLVLLRLSLVQVEWSVPVFEPGTLRNEEKGGAGHDCRSHGYHQSQRLLFLISDIHIYVRFIISKNAPICWLYMLKVSSESVGLLLRYTRSKSNQLASKVNII